MDNLLIRSSQIKKNANHIIDLLQLNETINSHGFDHFVSGSFFLDTMVWNDIDIVLAIRDIEMESLIIFYNELMRKNGLLKSIFKNEFIDNSGKEAYYLGCVFLLENKFWKIDFKFIKTNLFLSQRERITKTRDKISDSQRELIIKLKNDFLEIDPENGLKRIPKGISYDIYNLVLEEFLTDPKKIKERLKEKYIERGKKNESN